MLQVMLAKNLHFRCLLHELKGFGWPLHHQYGTSVIAMATHVYTNTNIMFRVDVNI